MATLPMLAICCICKRVSEAVSPSSPWTAMSAYLDRRHLRSIDVRLTHTYCPACYDRQARAWAIPRTNRPGRIIRAIRS